MWKQRLLVLFLAIVKLTAVVSNRQRVFVFARLAFGHCTTTCGGHSLIAKKERQRAFDCSFPQPYPNQKRARISCAFLALYI